MGEKRRGISFETVAGIGGAIVETLGRKNLARLIEMHVGLKTVLEVSDDGVVEEVAGRSAVHHNGDKVAVDAVLGYNDDRR